MKRTAAIATLAIALLTGCSSAADAQTVKIPARELTPVNVRTYDPVKVCERALTWTHKHPSSKHDDHAVRVCGRMIKTQHQADRLYHWANGRTWVLDLIG